MCCADRVCTFCRNLQALLDSNICKDRRDLFITTTLDPTDYHRVGAALEESLLNLGTEYVDLYLMNWPVVGCHDDNIEGRNRIWRCVWICACFALL